MGPEERPEVDLVEHEKLIADARKVIEDLDARLAGLDDSQP